MTDYTNVDFGKEIGTKHKWGAEMWRDCPDCDYEMALDGFDGDTCEEKWVCDACGASLIDDQPRVPTKQEQIEYLENIIQNNVKKFRDLSPAAREIAYDHCIKPHRRLQDQLRNYGKKFWER